MAPMTQNTSRTICLLALMKEGDDAFNSRDFAAMKAAHHPDMLTPLIARRHPPCGWSGRCG